MGCQFGEHGSNLVKMEANDNLNFHENHSSEHLNSSTNDNSTLSDVCVNHAEIAWHERRREWVGEISQKSDRPSREPILSWSATYDLLLSTEPFKRRIPLAEIVDFLVDIWHEDGLFD